MSNAPPPANGVVVFTHVQPYLPPGMAQAGIVSSQLGKFRKGQPKALGTVQIMLGVMILLIGSVLAVDTLIIGVFSGIFAWGSVIYIIAGALTVAADNNLNKCLVNGSLAMNIIATLTAFAGIVLYALDCAGFLLSSKHCHQNSPYSNCNGNSKTPLILSVGISAVMLIFSFLEVCVSIRVSTFACKAVCQTIPEPVFYMQSQATQGNAVAISSIPTAPQSNFDEAAGYHGKGVIPVAPIREEAQWGPPPPEYTTVYPINTTW